jgi:hypothetical protein
MLKHEGFLFAALHGNFFAVSREIIPKLNFHPGKYQLSFCYFNQQLPVIPLLIYGIHPDNI